MLAPVYLEKDGSDGEWFLLSLSDNGFITQNGFIEFGAFPYKDASGELSSFPKLFAPIRK